MQAKGQWGLVGTDLGAHFRPLGLWSKSTGRSSTAAMDSKLRMTRMQHHPEEKRQFRTCRKVVPKRSGPRIRKSVTVG